MLTVNFLQKLTLASIKTSKVCRRGVENRDTPGVFGLKVQDCVLTSEMPSWHVLTDTIDLIDGIPTSERDVLLPDIFFSCEAPIQGLSSGLFLFRLPEAHGISQTASPGQGRCENKVLFSRIPEIEYSLLDT